MDAKFLELTDKNDRPALINVNNITSVVVYTTPNEEVHVYVIGDKESYVTVKETYDEVRAKIAMVTGENVF